MMMWYASLILALLSIQVICGGSVLHHITPSSNLDCPIDEYCLNFSTFAANANNHTDSKDTALVLEFLVGNHILDSDFSISNITFLRLSTNSSNISTITCSRKALNMRFADIAEIEIQNLNFVDCGIMLQSVRQFVLEDSSFHATKFNGYGSSALQLNQIYAATIFSSSFTFNSHDIKVGTIIDSGFQSSRGGGALAVIESNLEISQSQFIGNTAGLGGAILVERNSNVAINDSLFDNNSAGSCNGFNCYGGALHIDRGSTVTAYNNTFLNNTSEFHGGAIAVFQSTYVDIHNVFYYNRAYYRRGGVVYEFISGMASHCSSNGIGGNGAAIFAQNNSQIMLVNSRFSDNYAENNGGVISAFFNCTITAHNSSFKNNYAFIEAGVIYAITSCYISLNRCSFIGNRAAYGGVMYAEEDSRVTVDSCNFDSNLATQDVGALIVIQSNITLAKSSFTNNTAYNDVGVLYATLFDIVINDSSFQDNKAGSAGGIMYIYSFGRLAITNSSFLNNKADFDGGVALVDDFSHVSFENCTFFNNTAFEGGVIFIRNVYFEDFGSTYIGNRASIDGGVIALSKGHVKIRSSTFINNTAKINGGVLHTPIHRFVHTILFEENTFDGNKAERGGVIALFNQDNIELIRNTFSFNKALDGGVVYLHTGNIITIEGGNFSNNSASNGGVIHLVEQNSLTIRNSMLNFNSATNSGGVLYSLLHNEIYFNGSSCFSIGNQAHSGGVIHANGSSVTLISQTLVMENNRAADAGGAVYLSNTNLTFSNAGDNTIVKNTAKTGGALFAVKSSVSVQSNSLLIANNTAMGNGGGMWFSQSQLTLFGGINELAENEAVINGGGVYASQSRVITITNSFTQMSSNTAILAGGGMYLTSSALEIEQNTLSITENRAVKGAGGGLHASNSSITIEGVLHCANNQAKNGGGFSLEKYARLYGKSAKNDSIAFFSNAASDHGGALYINDETNPDMCAVDPLQRRSSGMEYCFLNSYSPFFNTSGNSAGMSGSTLFGGLLDRCIIKPQFYKTAISGLDAFQKLSNVESDTISSHPVRMCFCRDFQPDCDYQPEPIQVQRQKAFSVQLIAYDQVNHTTKATVESSLMSLAGGLGEGQGTQQIIDGECTKLEFTLFSPLDSEELTLSLKSPCPNVTGVSKRSVRIEVICKCPIGFQLSNSANETACVCTCDDILQPYTRSECNASKQSIIRRDEFWITFINQTNASGYQIYPYCPFDYCRPPSDQVSVNLNVPHGSDAQCAAHRSGTLCDSCEPGYSISLGSSHCLQCPSHWPWLVATIAVVFILSGMALVAFLLVLNLTVAIGTLNAIIFYANVIAASRSALFPLKPSFASIFISFLNFDLGFDMCFFDGMDTYVKTWLQLAFPAYIIILVALIIKLSYHYTLFGCLIGKKDPVATLATLILLSYTKLLQTIITSFSSATLSYPDGSRNVIWLPDATIGYFTTKHAVLFCTAILILLLGLVYTFLLFTWQWMFRLPGKHVKWLKNPKLNAFLEVYLVPYTPKHRYWTGLLLLVRVILYLVSAFNPSGDPRITLLSTAFITSALFFYIAMHGVRMYKNWYINALETLTYFNVIAVSVITLYSLGSSEINQRAVTNVSVAVTFAQLLAVIIYHCFKNTMLSNIWKTKIYQKLSKKFQGIVDTNINQINDHEVLPIHQRRQINTIDHNSPSIHSEPAAKPTQSIIEPPSPRSVSAAPQTSMEKVIEVQEQETAPCQRPIDPATGDNEYSIDHIEIQ